MRKVLEEIKSFDIKKMLLLYDESLAAGEQLHSKDVCLFLGHTGAGKSTTLHFLAGSQMKIDSKTGHIYPTNVKSRFVSSATLNLENAGIE